MLKALTALAFPIYLATLIVLAIRGDLFSPNPIVIGVQLAGAALTVWARTAFPKDTFRTTVRPAGTAVIRRGPYRLIRHPMYAGALLLVWASIAGHPSLLNVALGILLSLSIVSKIVVEDRVLRTSLAGYDEYAHTTKALVPLVF